MKKLPLAVLVALVLATFAPLAAPGRALVYRDAVVYTAPQDWVLREAVLERGELPRTNPYLYSGVAHLADPSTQTLYPPRLLCALAFEPPRSIHVFVLMHFLIGALGAAFFARSLGASREGAAAAGAVYALSGPVLSLMENLPLLAGAAWLPWAGALARRRSVLAALPVALSALGGDLQAATWSALLVLGVLLARREAKRAAAASVLGLLLASALLLPAYRLFEKTDRAEITAEDAGRWCLAPARVVELAVPFPFGVSFPERRSVAHGLLGDEKITEPWSETIHAGVVGLALGAGALLDRRRRRAAAILLGLSALALAAAMGPRGPGVWHLLRLLPFYGVFRHPEKHAVLFALAAAPLAALGVDSARRAGALIGIAALIVAASVAFFEIDVAVRGAGRAVSPGALAHGVFFWQLPRALAFLGAAAALASRRRRAILALLVAVDVALATHPRIFLGDTKLYEEHPLGAELVRASGCRVLRYPWIGGERIGTVPSAEEMPGRSLEERAIAARVRSWVGSVAARERVPAAHGMSSFVPRGYSPLPHLDELSVRFLVTDGRGEGVFVLSSHGVALIDRGAGVARAPPVSFGGEVPGFALGAVLSLVAWVGLLAARRFLG